MSKLHKKNKRMQNYSKSYTNTITRNQKYINRDIAQANAYNMLLQFIFETLSWKFDFSSKKMENFDKFWKEMMKKFQSDIPFLQETYLKQKKRGLDLNERPKKIPYREKLKITGVVTITKDMLPAACTEFNNVYTSYLVAVVAVLKKHYSFSEKMINEFLDYIDYLTNNFFLGNIESVSLAYGLWTEKGFIVPGFEKLAEQAFKEEIERGCV